MNIVAHTVQRGKHGFVIKIQMSVQEQINYKTFSVNCD